LGIAGAEILLVSVHNTLGTAALWAGDLADADQHLRAAVETRLASPALAQLNAAAHRALLITEQGELKAAEASALQAVSTASAAGWEHTAQVVAAYLAMARILLDRDDPGGIDHWLSRIAGVQAVAPEPHIRLSAALVLAARREAAGDRERSLIGLRATLAELEGWSPPVPLQEQRLGYEARLLAVPGTSRTPETSSTRCSRPRPPPVRSLRHGCFCCWGTCRPRSAPELECTPRPLHAHGPRPRSSTPCSPWPPATKTRRWTTSRMR